MMNHLSRVRFMSTNERSDWYVDLRGGEVSYYSLKTTITELLMVSRAYVSSLFNIFRCIVVGGRTTFRIIGFVARWLRHWPLHEFIAGRRKNWTVVTFCSRIIIIVTFLLVHPNWLLFDFALAGTWSRVPGIQVRKENELWNAGERKFATERKLRQI